MNIFDPTLTNGDQVFPISGGLPGVYYGRLQTLTVGVTVNDAAQFIYALVWEERE